MDIIQRGFHGAPDLAAMADLAHRFPADNEHVADLPWRLSSWALDDAGNVGLWLDGHGHLLAWAVMQKPFWTIDYALKPAADMKLHRDVLAWADSRARDLLDAGQGLPAWFIHLFAHHTARRRNLEEAGFADQADRGEDSWSKVLMGRPASDPWPDSPVPPGYTIRPLAGESEVEAYVALHRAAFGTTNMTPEWRARTLRHPEYVPDLDLVAVAPDGSLAAFCVAWLDRMSHREVSGQIEPLGVHDEHRRLGLGRAILREALRRLHQHGARTVYVETDNYRDGALATYESAGFCVVHDVVVYGKYYAR
ncbi:MAG: GNAT family N-acetyltransferase [Anaerolineae bacterium]|nr:GNAT family N-acetyltransferase [Anaerolineae bacterium]